MRGYTGHRGPRILQGNLQEHKFNFTLNRVNLSLFILDSSQSEQTERILQVTRARTRKIARSTEDTICAWNKYLQPRAKRVKRFKFYRGTSQRCKSLLYFKIIIEDTCIISLIFNNLHKRISHRCCNF